MFRDRAPIRTRVAVTNSNILPVLWHPAQICPLPDNFITQIERRMKPFLFRKTKAPITFKLMCYPPKFRGIGVIDPESMFVANLGRVIARAFANQGRPARAFRVLFLKEIDKAGGSFFRLFDKGEKHYVHRMTPFWARIYETIRKLWLSISQGWDTYTDEEILNLPIDLPDMVEYKLNMEFGKRVRPSFFSLRIYSIRDVLIWDENEKRLKFIDTKDGSNFIENRLDLLHPEEALKLRQSKRKNWKYTNALSAMAFLRKPWPQIWDQYPAVLKQRIARIEEPSIGKDLEPLVNRDIMFNVENHHDLILWDKLTMAGMTCEKYSVKKAKQAVLKPEIIKPDWKHNPGLNTLPIEE
jgi:hypothetical protein